MSAQFPDEIYTPTTKENRPGVVYDAQKTKVIYAEDFNKDRDEIVAIETFLKQYQKKSVVTTSPYAPTDEIGERIIISDMEGSDDGLNLVASYEMDEEEWDGTAGEIIDESVNENNGQSVGAVVSESGKIDNCGNFNGSDHYVTVPTSESLEIVSNKLSVEIWVYCSANGSADYPGIISKKSNSGDAKTDWGLTLRESDKKIEVWINAGGNDYHFWSTNSISTDEWHQLLLIYNGSTLKLYIDNVENGSISASGNLRNSQQSLWIGRHGSDVNSRNWNGLIDLVRIWDREITSDERSNLYSGGSARLLDLSSATLEINLPTAVDSQATFIIKRTSDITVNINPDGDETIDDETILTLNSENRCVVLKSIDDNWKIISEYNPT